MIERTNEIILENFSFSVGRLVIKQTTTDTEVSVPDTALKAIGQVVSAPQQLLGIESNGHLIRPAEIPVPAAAQVTAPSPPKRRRKRKESVNGEVATTQGAGGTGDSIASQILELRRSGYFRQERDAAQVAAKLHQQGMTVANTNNVSMALLQLTREKDATKKLYRKKDSHKKWHYRDEPHDHD